MAVQIFYQYDFYAGKKSLEEIRREIIESHASKKIDANFLEGLVVGLPLSLAEIDAEISKFLQQGWSLDKLDRVMLQIIRLAVFELRSMKDIPSKVVIDEYVALAVRFFDSKKTAFVNAVLDKISAQLPVPSAQ